MDKLLAQIYCGKSLKDINHNLFELIESFEDSIYTEENRGKLLHILDEFRMAVARSEICPPPPPPPVHAIIPINTETYVCKPEIIYLPKQLPLTLRFLDCSDTKIRKLPLLPEKLEILHCKNTQIKVIPWPIPETLRVILCFGSPRLRLQKKLGESNNEYINRWRKWHIYRKCTLKARAIANELADMIQY